MDEEPRPITHDDLHATYVERSIRELQRMVQEEGGVLAELRRTANDVPVTSAVASLELMKTAYEDAARSEPFLPFADSILPALLALRKTFQVTAESQAYLEGTLPSAVAPSLDEARKQLALDKARLGDQKALRAALEARLADLRSGLEARSAMTAEERRQEKLEALRTKKRDYDGNTAALLRALKQFIQDQLGPMLVAEELGGPVVGSILGIQNDDLAAGFSSQGKLRKPPAKGDAAPRRKVNGTDRRQRRIDEIWGARRQSVEDEDEGEDDHENTENGNEAENENEWNESTTASAEMQELTEELLNSLASAGGDSSAAYVTITRESAAARFLVRSKVAQFHPRDATKLRLIDFGRELDD